MNSSEYDVKHLPGEQRFEVEVDGKTAVLEYMNRSTLIVMSHTEVPVGLEGRGIGSTLAKTALDWAIETGKSIVPVCPYVKAYVDRHPDYKKYMAPGYR